MEWLIVCGMHIPHTGWNGILAFKKKNCPTFSPDSLSLGESPQLNLIYFQGWVAQPIITQTSIDC